MEFLAWIWWILTTILSYAWAIVWFLVGGWVSTLAQIAVVIFAIYGLKYGWKRAPLEILKATRRFGRFFWFWIRAREPGQDTGKAQIRTEFVYVRNRQPGDINVSTLMSLFVIAGLVGMATWPAG